jgi:hypothetical protein
MLLHPPRDQLCAGEGEMVKQENELLCTAKSSLGVVNLKLFITFLKAKITHTSEHKS